MLKSRVRWLRWGAALLVVGSILVLLFASQVGHWLVVSDPLEHAPAIVVLSGEWPFRALEAVSLFEGGWAEEVWLIADVSPSRREVAIEALGMRELRSHDYSRQILEQHGIPPASIRLLDGHAKNTAEEVLMIARRLRMEHWDRAILVTSPAHTRRVRLTWNTLVGNDLRAIVRAARGDTFAADRWWATTDNAYFTVREVLGIVNAWLTFPIGPT